MKYGKLELGQVEAIVNKLGGMDGVLRLLAGELVVKPESEKVFPVWKTIKLGTGLKTADDFRKSLKDNGFKIGNLANDILGKSAFKKATEEIKVDLVKATVAELGFKQDATCEQIYKRAKNLGLDMCPAEVGPQLRLQYKDQSNGEWLFVAMESITDSDGGLSIFYVGCSGLWLCSYNGYPDDLWDSNDRLVFVRPRK